MKVDAGDLSRKIFNQIKASENNQICVENCLSKSCNGNGTVPDLFGMKEIPGGNFGASFSRNASIVHEYAGAAGNNCGIAFPCVDELPAGQIEQLITGTDRNNPAGKFIRTFSECFHVAKAFVLRVYRPIPDLKNPDKQLYVRYNCKEVISCEG